MMPKIVKYPVKKSYDKNDYHRDCPNGQYIGTILKPVKRIIAIGDIHGDLDLAIQSFKTANLIDDNYNWIANPPQTVVVQVGDQVDSCRPIPNVHECQENKYPEDAADDVNIINFFDEMHRKASEKGGAVYSLLGNHELMNAQANFRYVSHDNYFNFEYHDDNGDIYYGPKGRKNSFKPGGPLAKRLACNRPSVLIIGSTMFVHAGVLPALATNLDHLKMDNRSKLKYINSVVRKWLLNKITDENNKINKNGINDLINDTKAKISPFWTRIYGSIPINTDLNVDQCSEYVKKALEIYKVGQLVVGHTPQIFINKDGINGTCHDENGKQTLYRVDGGFSKAFSIFEQEGSVQVLEIIDDTEFNIITEPDIDLSSESNDHTHHRTKKIIY